MSPEEPAVVSVSKLARRVIDRHGGQLWVWGSSLGPDLLLHATTSPGPDGVEFELIQLDGVVVWLDRALGIDQVKIAWTLLTGFDVRWPGAVSVSADSGG